MALAYAFPRSSTSLMPSTRAMVESIGISLQITDLAGYSPTGTRVSMKAWLDPSALPLPRTSKLSKTREYVLCWSVRFLTVHLILALGSPDPASSSLPTWLSTSWARGAGPMAPGQPTLCEYNKGIEEVRGRGLRPRVWTGIGQDGEGVLGAGRHGGVPAGLRPRKVDPRHAEGFRRIR